MRTYEELDEALARSDKECANLREGLERGRETLHKAIAERADMQAKLAAPMAIVLVCPLCKQQHVDEGDWETRAHRTHRCVAGPFGPGCGHEWRPSNRATRGVTYDYLRDEHMV
jgi:DNA repair exonuclease SbcCD ATPase subunit